MVEELGKLVKYAEDNGLSVVFTDSKILKDYAAMNPEAAKAMGFPDIDSKLETQEILVDKTVPEKEQIKNLKHELIELRLMREGSEYWSAHEISLRDEDKPFDYSKLIPAKIEPEPLSYYTQPTMPIIPSIVPSKIVKRKKVRHNVSRAGGYKLDFEGMKDF